MQDIGFFIDTVLWADDFALDQWSSADGPTAELRYQFAGAGSHGPAFSPSERQPFLDAFAHISELTNVRFVEADGADASLTIYSSRTVYASGSWSYSGYTWDASVTFRSSINLNRANEYDLILHELGHALGLKHPGEYDALGEFPPGPFLPGHLDNAMYSLMSYIDAPDAIEPDTFMLYDVAALQHWWGPNEETRLGDDIYHAQANGRRALIWDAGGTDAISAGAAETSRLDLSEGAFSTIDGQDLLVIAFGAQIEDAHGGAGADAIFGNALDNVFIGGAGADQFYGGDGSDAVRFDIETGDLGARVNLGQRSGVDSFGDRDTYDSVERLVGGEHDDVLFGAGADEVFIGNAGDDSLNGKGGADTLDGGFGDDVLVGGDGDDILTGGAGADVIGGRTGDDEISGEDGDDVILGQVGDDFIDGGDGDDRINGGTGADAARGAGGADVLLGRAGADELFGGAGDDALNGGTGADRLDGGLGDDRLIGGADADLFVYSDVGFGADTVVRFQDGLDQFEISAALAANIDELSIAQNGDDAVISFGEGSITVLDRDVDTLSEADFLFV